MEDLRSEAIRQIKELNNLGSSPEISGKIFSWNLGRKRKLTLTERAILISWIKYFFNLSEKDIEEAKEVKQ